MTFPIKFHPDVKLEIREAYLWYESQSNGLGKNYIIELECAYQLIQESPTVWPKRKKTFYFYPIQTFPFSIYYTFEEEIIIVYAIAHNARKPFYWQERTHI